MAKSKLSFIRAVRGLLTRVVGAIVLVGLLGGRSEEARAYGGSALSCPPYQEPVIDLNIVNKPLRYDLTRDVLSIEALAVGRNGGLAAGARQLPVGLTTSRLQFQSSMEIKMTAFPGDPLLCGQVARATMTLGLENTTVYVGREFPQGSCAYGEILAHEHRHVQADRELVDAYRPVLFQAVRSALIAQGRFRAGSRETAQVAAKRVMDAAADDVLRRMEVDRSRRHGAIDTLAEYQRVSYVCNGEVARVVTPVLRGRESRGRPKGF